MVPIFINKIEPNKIKVIFYFNIQNKDILTFKH